MIVAAHQLHYLPWLRYFHKMALCDTFIVLDNIQFNKSGWQNRNKIKTAHGEQILTVPILHRFQQFLSEVQIDPHQPWPRKHWRSLETNYGRAPYFEAHQGFFRQVFEKPWERLNDLNDEILNYLISALGIKVKVIRSSDLTLKGEASDRLISLCEELGARSYLTGSYAAKVYLDPEPFRREGIELIYQEWHSPEYPQLHPEVGFIPDLSIVDLLFNCGPKSLEILMQGSPKVAGEKS